MRRLHANRKRNAAPQAGDRDILKQSKTSSGGYAHDHALAAKKLFSSWGPGHLQEAVRRILSEAKTAEAGDWLVFVIPGTGMLVIDFKGSGGVEIGTQTTLCRPLVELGTFLRLVLGSDLTVAGADGVSK